MKFELNEYQADFALKFLQKMHPNELKTAVVSPLSISLSLAIIHNGASGETVKQISALLIGENAEESVNEYFGKVYLQLKSLKSSNFDLKNQIRSFVKCQFQPNATFINETKMRYDEHVIPKSAKSDVCFFEPEFKSFAQNFVEMHDYGMLFMNDMFFNGEWKHQFDSQGIYSVKEKFHVTENITQDVYYMEKTSNVFVESTPTYHVLGFEYIDNCSMFIILPKKKFNLREIMKALNGEILIKHSKNLKEQYVTVKIPRFCCKTQIDAVDILKTFGCVDVFDKEKAELFHSRNENRIFIEQMLHNFEIKMYEKGTEINTSICDWSYAGPGYPLTPSEGEFIVDQPFCFYIADKHFNISFIGVVKDNFQFDQTQNLLEEYKRTYCSLYSLPRTPKYRELKEHLPNKHVIDLEIKNEQYFENPFLQPSLIHFEQQVNRDWLLTQIGMTIYQICNRNITHVEISKNEVFGGIGGIVYGLLRAEKYVELSIKSSFFHVCEGYMKTQQFAPPKTPFYFKFLKGSLGLHIVKALLGVATHQTYDIDEIFHDIDFELNEAEESVFERFSGTLAGIRCAKMELKKNMLVTEKIHGIMSSLITNIIRTPLKFRGDTSEVFENLQLLICFWDDLNSSEKQSIKEFLNLILTNQTSDGNIFYEEPSFEGQICKGVSAACRLFIVAYIVLDDNKYLEASKKLCDLIWKRGLSFEYQGLYDGIPGNGYALLLMYRLTKDENYLKKAKLFAILMIQTQNTFHENPYSLFEGWTGSLCFLMDILEPDNAQFPLFPIPFRNR